jgi:hypothetical protein
MATNKDAELLRAERNEEFEILGKRLIKNNRVAGI